MGETFDKAIIEFEKKNYNGAYGLFEESADANPNAMVNLAIMHMKGQGCERSNVIAKNWFEKAAEHSHPQALNSLAIFYEKGMHGEVDRGKALEYYKQAADFGNVEAQLKAGMLFKEDGKHTQAMRYLITAAHNDNSQAQEIITYVSNADKSIELNKEFRILDGLKQKALIDNLLQTKIRPTLAVDGGGIELLNYIPGEKPQVWLSYTGSCSGCHLGSTSTADMLLDNFQTMIDKNVVLYLM
ncbi:NifU family protein [Sulfurimonas sp.]|uniref:NifU family protein n=1 Tax=Sulfurimonas sp. TaxID=2022749 RepID=UPI0039E5180B